MTTKVQERQSTPDNSRQGPRRGLSKSQVQMIDEALGAVGDFGEVRLIVQNGRLHFLVTQKSHDALKYRPGGFSESLIALTVRSYQGCAGTLRYSGNALALNRWPTCSQRMSEERRAERERQNDKWEKGKGKYNKMNDE